METIGQRHIDLKLLVRIHEVEEAVKAFTFLSSTGLEPYKTKFYRGRYSGYWVEYRGQDDTGKKTYAVWSDVE